MKAEDVMTANPVTIDHSATVSDAINLVKENRVHELVVVRDNKPVGMLSPRALIERSVKLEEKISKLMFVSPTLQKKDDISRIVEIFMLSGSRDLPVLDGNELAGIVSEMDVLATVGNGRKARDVMRPIKYLSKIGESANDARKKIINHKINRLPVLDNNGKLAGILSTVDLLDFVLPTSAWRKGERKGETTNEKSGNVKIESIMQDKVYCVEPDESLNDVIVNMKDKGISSVVVTENQKPVGIITPKCILSLMMPVSESLTNLVVTGLSDNYIDKKYLVENAARKGIDKMGRLTEIISFAMDFKEHRKIEGQEKTKYEIKARVKSSAGNFYATAVDWDINKAVKEITENLERGIKKKLGKNA
ncbi:MAG: CBS domain-containing protein [Candidatus Aenigmarchaeota archaeon]|nr:CBS domain-containing protein [Candidatus Aenigmarchaeota archaeon]